MRYVKFIAQACS